MPRYFFTVHRQDRVENDPVGTYLPDAEAALAYADYTIRELRRKSGYEDDLSLMMIVRIKPDRRFCPCRFSPAAKSSPHC